MKSIVYNICNIFVLNIFLSGANLPHVSRRRSPLCYLVKFSPRGDRSTGAPKLLSCLGFGSFLTFSLSSSFHSIYVYWKNIYNDRVIETPKCCLNLDLIKPSLFSIFCNPGLPIQKSRVEFTLWSLLTHFCEVLRSFLGMIYIKRLFASILSHLSFSIFSWKQSLQEGFWRIFVNIIHIMIHIIKELA